MLRGTSSPLDDAIEKKTTRRHLALELVHHGHTLRERLVQAITARCREG